MKQFLSTLSILLFFGNILAQQPATTAQQVESGLQQKAQLAENSIVKNLPFKNIGPTIMSGRVVDFAVNPENPTEFYVGYASGGVWHTKNNGTTFEPILDSSPTQNVGSLAVDWETRTIWVGTGEVNASRSSYAGIGLLKSSDNGKTWQNMGLKDSHHISKIIINPANADEVVVAAVGHLYSKNDERGVFKTFDGGKTWNKTLFVNNQSGIIEMDAHPTNFNIMYASSWDKDRKAWNFRGSGEGSSIYKSTDGGSSWTKVSGAGSGFPTGEGVGRIGLAVFDENTVYAIHDNQFRRDESPVAKKGDGLTKEQFKTMTSSQFLQLEDEKLNAYLKENGFQEKYRADNVKNMVRGGTVRPADLAKYLEDANTMLFDTPVIGAEVYKSTNGGKTWKKTHDGFLDGLYYSYGYYFGKIHVDPNNEDGIYIYGVPILKSKDGGKTFKSISAPNVHADHHALWINPNMPGHLIDGNDGGVNISYDDGENWIKNNAPSVGQFYAIQVDNEEPYHVYGGLQDNGVWVGAHTYEPSPGWRQNGKYPYEFIMGGDGMQIQVDSRNSDIVYTGFQFGNYFRLNRETGEQTYIQPKHELGENPYRFNWQTPILLSPHNQDILYLGGNKLMRSMNQGNDWTAISPDLTNGGKKGNVAYGTITSIAESPFQFGLLYTGSDDGLVYASKNGGGDWQQISATFPKDLWVSRVVASEHKKERVYVTLNGYRWDDFKPYVYISDNFGVTWRDISNNLPSSPVNVIREDPENENILYLGTDNGAYVSFNQGESWEIFAEGLPNVAVHDLVVQEREKDLVVGTHGRSIYVADVGLLQQLSSEKMNALVLAEIPPLRASRRWGSTGFNQFGDFYEPSVLLQVYAPSSGTAEVSIKAEDGTEIHSFNSEVEKGVNIVEYDVSVSEKGKKTMEKKNIALKEADNGKFYLPKGNYSVQVSLGNLQISEMLEIK
ncbi:WD40/YVTN/BNR-like repeat-containing protein [Marinirhabdus gelatinilytica]|uniref:Sortilin (Neurotensin receptor 3) n=1 Tax=Marinirhabdus gelatinilytica TaxID=1703343 RepID=A0A370QJF6_9FLAO|nr:glycosyl hydrolase [Marinirhabdus gelatinilytica]RDK88210.1 sortilin (neurotensin receptor 3) [Marinirhabdus gelatinilytica]